MTNLIKLMTTALLVAVLPSAPQCMMNNNTNVTRNNILNNVNNIQQYINNLNNYLQHINEHCRIINERYINQNLEHIIDRTNDTNTRIGRIEHYIGQIQNEQLPPNCINNLRQDVNSMRQHHNFQNNMIQNMNNNINNNINNFNHMIHNMNLNNNGNNIFNNNINFNNNQNNIIPNININDNRSLKDLLHMDMTFSDILNAIKNNENIDANINKFYDYILENKLYNLERIISQDNIANKNELNAIREILDMEIVRNKFIHYITEGELPSINKQFTCNDFGTVILPRKDQFLSSYESAMKSLAKKKLKIYQQEGAQDFNILQYLEKLLNKQQENTVKYNIVMQVLDLFTTLFHDHEKTFKELEKYHNLRNIINAKDGNDKMKNTFSQMQTDIENDIINKRDMNIANSSKEFYDSLFGNDFDNFETVLQSGTQEEYQIILDILRKQQIQDYISGGNIKDKLNTKEKWLEEYNKCEKILNKIDTIYNSNIANQNNKDIFQIVKNCFDRRIKINEEQNNFNIIMDDNN